MGSSVQPFFDSIVSQHPNNNFMGAFSFYLPLQENPLDSEEPLSDEDVLSEDLGSEDSDGSKTRVLGDWDKNNEDSKEESGSASLKQAYWKVVHEEQKKIRKSNPEMPAKKVLEKARAVFLWLHY